MTRRAKAAVLDAALKKMFQALEARPAPDAIVAVADQLEAPPRPRLKKAS